MQKSFKWSTIGFFSVSESKVIAKLQKKVKQEVAQFSSTKIVQTKRDMCLEICAPKTVSPKIICGKYSVKNYLIKLLGLKTITIF